MTAAITPPTPGHESPRRFGMALVTGVLVIAVIAFGVYRINPRSRLQKNTNTAGLSGFAAATATSDPRLNNVISAFVEALQREDDAAMRAVYPNLTEHDAGVLHAVRRRLGPSTLRVGNLKLQSMDADKARVDFLVVTNNPAEQLRLPFEATMAKMRGEWRIAELH